MTLVPSVSWSGISSGRSFSACITHKNKQLIAASVADPGYRIREAYPGSGFSPFRILDPGVKNTGSGTARLNREIYLVYLTQKYIYDPGCSFRIPDPDFSIPDTGSRGKKPKIPDTATPAIAAEFRPNVRLTRYGSSTETQWPLKNLFTMKL